MKWLIFQSFLPADNRNSEKCSAQNLGQSMGVEKRHWPHDVDSVNAIIADSSQLPQSLANNYIVTFNLRI